MKKYTEQDINIMLSKTEKTEPDFDKKVIFPIGSNVKRPRRRFGYLIAAACLVIFSVIGSMSVLLNDSSQFFPEISNVNSDNILTSIDSENPYNESNIHGEASFDFSTSPDESRNVLDTSEPDIDDISDSSNIEKPIIEYPEDADFFVGMSVNDGETAYDYFLSNPLKHLNTKLKLPIYTRESVNFTIKGEFITRFGNSIGTRFIFDNELYEITGDFRGVARGGEMHINVSEYGDWYFGIQNGTFLNVAVISDINKSLTDAVASFINDNQTVFENHQYKYHCSIKDDVVTVALTANELSDDVLSGIPMYYFSFEKNNDKIYSLKSVKHVVNGMALYNEFDIIDYDIAVNKLLSGNFLDEYANLFNKDFIEYKIIGYDVRYLYNARYAAMYPFYAFVVEIEPNSDSSVLHTEFVPAIDADN